MYMLLLLFTRFSRMNIENLISNNYTKKINELIICIKIQDNFEFIFFFSKLQRMWCTSYIGYNHYSLGHYECI